MSTRRQFIKNVANATVGIAFTGCGCLTADAALTPQTPAVSGRREVMVGGRRANVIDIHAHCVIPEVADLVKETPFAGFVSGPWGPLFTLGPQRITELDARGVDIQVLSYNPIFWWYAADRDLADKIVKVQNAKLVEWCSAHPDRFAALASVALQHPDLAAAQLEHAVKEQGFKGAAIGGHVDGEPLSSPRFDPFWAKAQELDVLVFMHPQSASNIAKSDAFHGKGDLPNIVGNPLESAVFLAHMIYEGTLDRFPTLKICVAHGGGYLPSYLGRFEVACDARPNAKCANKKHPSEYLKDQIWVDTMVNSEEGVRHLVAEVGAKRVIYGTDIPYVWPDSIDFVLRNNFNDEDKLAILGGNLRTLLKL